MDDNLQQKKKLRREIGVGLREQFNYSTDRSYKQQISQEHLGFLEGYNALQDALDAVRTGALKRTAVAQAVRATAPTYRREVWVYLINPHITEITGAKYGGV